MSLNHYIHNEYFYIVSKSTCPTCNSKTTEIYGWGSYISRQFHTIKYFCRNCFSKEVEENLIIQQKASKCIIRIKGLNKERLPQFLLDLHNFLNGKSQLSLIPEIKNPPIKVKKIKSISSTNQLSFFGGV